MLPKNWNDVTVEQYNAIHKTFGEDPQDDEGQWKLLVKRVALITGNEPDWVEDNLTVQDLHRMSDLLKTPLPTLLVRHFRFNNRRYVVDIDPTKYNAGRYMSVMNAVKDPKADNTHKLLFQVCREIDFGFYRNNKGKLRFGVHTIEPDLNKLAEHIESFKELPLKIANPIKVFFCSLSENLTDATLEYLTKQAKETTSKLQTEIDYLNGSAG